MRKGPKRYGLSRPSVSAMKFADNSWSRHQTMVWLSCTAMQSAFSQLTPDVECVVTHLVHGMDGDPAQRTLRWLRVVVDHSPLPAFCWDAVEDVGEHRGRVI